MRAAILTVVLLILASSNYSVVIKPINTNENLKMSPTIYGDFVTWQEAEVRENTTTDIVIHNLKTGEEWRIEKPENQTDPVIYKNHLVYRDWINRTHCNLCLYDLSTKKEKVIASSIRPWGTSIFEERVAYADLSRSDRIQICLYNITTGKEELVVKDNAKDCFIPQIYGDNLIYIKGRLLNTGNVAEPSLILRNLKNGEEKVLSTEKWMMASLYGDKVVWGEGTSPLNNSNSIMVYNITTKEKRKLPLKFSAYGFSLYKDIFVFNSLVNETVLEVGGYDLLTDTYFPISTPENAGQALPRIYENKVVWIDYRNSPQPLNSRIIQKTEVYLAEITKK